MSKVIDYRIRELEDEAKFGDEGVRSQINETIKILRAAGRKPYSPEKLRSFKSQVCFNAAEYELLQSVSDGKEFAESIRELALEAAKRRKELTVENG